MIFLDNCSTTEAKFFRSDYKDFWMNSNTPYTKTKEQVALEEAREKIKSCLNVKGGYVLFFRCATEAIQWLANKIYLREVWCSPYEHESVYSTSSILNEESEPYYNIKCKFARCSLYCHQLVNQITGDVWDIKQAKEKYVSKPNQFFGSDLTAAIGHVVLPNDLEEYCDALWFSGHKFYTEKNVGAMWISDRLGEYLNANKDPKNQYDLVHGTVDVAGACMIADAMEWVSGTYDERCYQSLILTLGAILHNNNIDYSIISKDIFTKTYAINAICLPNINADALQSYLASKDIYIGVAHSACAGTNDYRVLETMGYDKETASQTIRVSFGVNNTCEDVKKLADEIKNFHELF